jgi:tRNA (mo5U34)-methyltransferase
MHGAGAAFTLGIDPTPLFAIQFRVLQKYLNFPNVQMLPLGIEDLPQQMRCFDTTFSMGILYHRKSPINHLLELRDTLRSGGELVLETIVVDGEEGYSLVPAGRYGKMGNVWFLPSVATLISWLEKVKFKNVRCVDIDQTSIEEQRTTEWMTFQSLKDFLDPEDHSKTIEGYPAPKRAVIIAEAP